MEVNRGYKSQLTEQVPGEACSPPFFHSTVMPLDGNILTVAFDGKPP